jgi:hypothetical protein
MIVLHATEPATPYLSLFARIDSFTQADLDDALSAAGWSSLTRRAGRRMPRERRALISLSLGRLNYTE